MSLIVVLVCLSGQIGFGFYCVIRYLNDIEHKIQQIADKQALAASEKRLDRPSRWL